MRSLYFNFIVKVRAPGVEGAIAVTHGFSTLYINTARKTTPAVGKKRSPHGLEQHDAPLPAG